MTLASDLLSLADAAVLAPAGPPPPRQEEQFVMGLVADPSAPGPAGDLTFNVYVAIAADGTGYGTLSDPLHPLHSCDLRVLSQQSTGHRVRWTGLVARSADPRLVGQPFALSATVHGRSASPLELEWDGRTFRGRGLVVIAIIAVLISMLLPSVR